MLSCRIFGKSRKVYYKQQKHTIVDLINLSIFVSLTCKFYMFAILLLNCKIQ